MAILGCVSEALLVDNLAVNREAAAAILSFAQAIGFDSGTGGAPGAAGEIASAWTFHQQLLLRAEGCAQAVVALRHHVVRVLREWAAAGTPTPQRAPSAAQRASAADNDSDSDEGGGGDSIAGDRKSAEGGSGTTSRPPLPPPPLRRMPDMVRMLLQVSPPASGLEFSVRPLPEIPPPLVAASSGNV